MLDLQTENIDFLIRHNLMNGPDDEPTIVGNLFDSLGFSGAAIGLAIFTKSPTMAAMILGASQQVSGFQEAEQAGKDPFTAATLGTAQGIVEAGISMIGLGKIIKIVNVKSASIVKKILASIIVEGIEEGVTDAINTSIQNITGVTDITLEEGLNIVVNSIFYGGLGGGLVVGGITTTTSIFISPSSKRPPVALRLNMFPNVVFPSNPS